MEICLVAAPAGNRFYIFDAELHRATSIWHSDGGQHDVVWRDPLDHSSSEHRSRRLPRCLALISRQVSIFRRLRSGSYPAAASGLHKQQPRRPTERASAAAPRRDNSGTACLCSWSVRDLDLADAIVMRGSGIFHLSLAAWLAANGLCLPWFNPPSLQSAITYEMTTVSHPVSHLPQFHTSQQPNHSWEINERRWGVVGDSLITPAHAAS